MKVNDYVLTEKHVRQYVRECIVKANINLDSDHPNHLFVHPYDSQSPQKTKTKGKN